MEFLVDFLKSVLMGFIRALSAHVFRTTIFENEKTTQRRQKRGGSHKNNL